jgi:HK97 family phage portal protein
MGLLTKIDQWWETKWSKVTNVLVAGGNGAVWSRKRYDVFAKEAYLTNVISFRCIDAIAKAVESVEWKIEQKKRDGSVEEVTDHPVIDLMYRPNPEEDWGFLLYKHIAFLIISGNAYMERITVDNGARTRELWTHRPDRMHIVVNPISGLRKQYEYRGPSGRIANWKVDELSGKSDIWHLRTFNPLDDWYGAGPVEPTSREIDTANEAMEWNKNLLQNGARPSMIITFKGNIGETEYNRLEKMLRDKRSGPKNAGKTLIIEGEGATAAPYGYSPEEMDYIEGNRELARRISYGFGVPPQLIGIPGDNTYSNYSEARCSFWEDTVFFYLRRFGRGFSQWQFEKDERTQLVPNLDSIPALEPRRKEQFEKAERADFLTINEKRDMTGYEKYKHVQDEAEEDDPADKIYQNASMMPLGENPQEDMGAGSAEDIAAAEDEAGGKPKPDAGADGKLKPGEKPKPGDKEPPVKKPKKPGDEGK